MSPPRLISLNQPCELLCLNIFPLDLATYIGYTSSVYTHALKVVVTYPEMMYKMGGTRGTRQVNPMEEIFRKFALHDPLPFEAMLSIAAKHRAGVEGHADDVQSLTHKMRALRMINERLQSNTGSELDSTIYSAATLAVIEVCFSFHWETALAFNSCVAATNISQKWSKDATIERMHVKGLAYLIRRRGGMRGLRLSSPFLESVLYWYGPCSRAFFLR